MTTVIILSSIYKVTTSRYITSTISYLAKSWMSLWFGPSSVTKRYDFTFPIINFPFY